MHRDRQLDLAGEKREVNQLHSPDCRGESVLCRSWSLLVRLESFSSFLSSSLFLASCVFLSLLLVFLSTPFSSPVPLLSVLFFPFFLSFFVTFSPPPPLPVGRRPICSNTALHCVVADAAGQTAVEPLYTEVYVSNRGVQQHVCQLV